MASTKIHVVRRRHQRPKSSMLAIVPSKSIAVPKYCIRNPSSSRSLSSSSSSKPRPSTENSSSPVKNSAEGSSGGVNVDKTTKTAAMEIVPNVALASVLFAFVTGVFLYSMNAVGRGDGDGASDDPLAQLKAEAQEAREHRDRVGQGGVGGRMTPDEILALESGLGAAATVADGEALDGERIILDVAVAAPADVAALEEEVNLRVFRQNQQQNDEKPKEKKPWWRFGF